MRKLFSILILSSLLVQPIQFVASNSKNQDSECVMYFAAYLFDFALYHQAFGPSDDVHEQEIQEFKMIFQKSYDAGDQEVKNLKESMQNSFKLSEFCELIDVNYDLLGADRQVTMLELFTLYALVDPYIVQLLLDLGYNVDQEAEHIINQISQDLKNKNITNREKKDLYRCIDLIVNAASPNVRNALYIPVQ